MSKAQRHNGAKAQREEKKGTVTQRLALAPLRRCAVAPNLVPLQNIH